MDVQAKKRFIFTCTKAPIDPNKIDPKEHINTKGFKKKQVDKTFSKIKKKNKKNIYLIKIAQIKVKGVQNPS